jgi:hypothetical protein
VRGVAVRCTVDRSARVLWDQLSRWNQPRDRKRLNHRTRMTPPFRAILQCPPLLHRCLEGGRQIGARRGDRTGADVLPGHSSQKYFLPLMHVSVPAPP